MVNKILYHPTRKRDREKTLQRQAGLDDTSQLTSQRRRVTKHQFLCCQSDLNQCWLWCIDECMVSIIKVNNGIKEPACVYQNCNTNQILIFGGYVKAGESLRTQVITWVRTNLNHIDTKMILPRYESSCTVYRHDR